ncbi:MAG: hypothetical protein K6347_03625 [Campylobacterales bacterium]
MSIEIKENRTPEMVEVVVSGTIKSVDDSMKIKEALIAALATDKSVALRLVINDSFIVTSSVIGFLLKLIQKDRINLTVVAKKSELYELFESLRLVSLLNVVRE